MSARCVVKSWRGNHEMSVSTALTPDDKSEGGVAERAEGRATQANEVLGRLLAALVERKILTISEASEVAGNFDDIEEVT